MHSQKEKLSNSAMCLWINMPLRSTLCAFTMDERPTMKNNTSWGDVGKDPSLSIVAMQLILSKQTSLCLHCIFCGSFKSSRDVSNLKKNTSFSKQTDETPLQGEGGGVFQEIIVVCDFLCLVGEKSAWSSGFTLSFTERRTDSTFELVTQHSSKTRKHHQHTVRRSLNERPTKKRVTPPLSSVTFLFDCCRVDFHRTTTTTEVIQQVQIDRLFVITCLCSVIEIKI